MQLDERRKIREIRQRLKALSVSELDMVVKGVQQRHGQEFIIELADVREERERLRELLEVYETQALIRKAEKFGIEVPYKREWFTEVMPDPYDPDTKHELALDRLNERGRAAVTRQIWDARIGRIKDVVSILMPVLGWIVAILALLKDIIIQSLKQS